MPGLFAVGVAATCFTGVLTRARAEDIVLESCEGVVRVGEDHGWR